MSFEFSFQLLIILILFEKAEVKDVLYNNRYRMTALEEIDRGVNVDNIDLPSLYTLMNGNL